MSLSAHLRRIGRLMEVLAYGEPTFLKQEAERIMSKAREGLKNDAIKKKIIDFLEDDTPLGTGYGAYMAGLKGSSEEVYEMAEAIRDYAETQAMGLGHSRAELFGLV